MNQGDFSSVVYATELTPQELKGLQQAQDWAAPLRCDTHERDWRILY